MAKRESYTKEILSMAAEQRLAEAREVIEGLTRKASEMVHLHESNRLLVYSTIVTQKVPDGRAARALNATRIACARYEVILLRSVWDKPEENAVSVCRAVALMNDDAVIQLAAQDTYHHHAVARPGTLDRHTDPEKANVYEEFYRQSQHEFALQRREMTSEGLRSAVKKVQYRIDSVLMGRITNLRDHLSHSLTRTWRELEGASFDKVRGDEISELLIETVGLIQEMYCWANGTSFDISEGVRDQARRYASILWENIRFDAPR